MNWKVIQRRVEDGIDFRHDWDTYVSGFGDPSGSFWIGLDTIHILTSDCTTELRVNLRKQDGCVAHAHYTTFTVGAQNTNYTYVQPVTYLKGVPCYINYVAHIILQMCASVTKGTFRRDFH